MSNIELAKKFKDIMIELDQKADCFNPNHYMVKFFDLVNENMKKNATEKERKIIMEKVIFSIDESFFNEDVFAMNKESLDIFLSLALKMVRIYKKRYNCAPNGLSFKWSS
jgi:hypothetical protein